tara:strand:+ start:560 stop:781 length:222 start_codon:yes stop_codon:yes gene_type:complete
MTEENTNDFDIVMDAPNFPITAISIRDSDSSTEDITKQTITKSPSIEIDKNTMSVKSPSHKLDIEERKKPKFK